MSITSRHRTLIAYFLLGLFCLPGIGFSATVQYCDGHLAGLKFSLESNCCAEKEVESCNTSKSTCCSKSDSDDKDCCDDKPSFNQLDYDGLSHTAGITSDVIALPYVAQTYINHALSQRQTTYNPLYPQPPPLSGFELRIKYESFLC